MEAILAPMNQREAVADALTRAFADDPVNTYIFRDRESRMRKMHWIFTRWLGVVIARNGVYTTPDFAGAALWLSPEAGGTVSFMEMMGAGLLSAAFLLNPAEQVRGLRVYLDIHLRMRRFLDKPHWVLDTLGVAPEHHRKGVARALLQPVLRQADADGIPCFVNTHRSVNVHVYERLGFTLIHQSPIFGLDMVVYSLRREPQGTQASTTSSPAPATD